MEQWERELEAERWRQPPQRKQQPLQFANTAQFDPPTQSDIALARQVMQNERERDAIHNRRVPWNKRRP